MSTPESVMRACTCNVAIKLFHDDCPQMVKLCLPQDVRVRVFYTSCVHYFLPVLYCYADAEYAGFAVWYLSSNPRHPLAFLSRSPSREDKFVASFLWGQRRQSCDGEKIRSTVIVLACRKVAGVNTCHSPTTFGGYGITCFIVFLSLLDLLSLVNSWDMLLFETVQESTTLTRSLD